ncbi:sugar transferase [Amycolatopsis viridis]|uniref:Lipopolysaccharide/colanic/teichoic acid biosynthesis glycosyltransferase n=1 Tax=Amycolatopsis viridis TaxID=185678 RepID=A0ABX0SYZ2_9PSEU|nr:sugar transferase [Amycolatopsis viridis]NIH80864.1 lipopolysaccharide/colanic/teichoic acid biosynthesis glycosyltransferase [Amycolatopsis viridis]
MTGEITTGTIVPDTRLRRAADLAVAVTALVVLLPLLVVIALAIKLTSRGPAVYRQRRVGRDGRPFLIWKFRTMVANAERIGPAVSGSADPRITRVGRWLRATRLDELPQLVNLLRGDMTLIGPRPEVERFLRYYTPAERRLLTVRPGIIGPGALLFAAAQSQELTHAADPEAHYVAHHLHPKLALDLAYLARRGPRADLALLARTVRIVLSR